jgi:hypothetical protein
MLAKLEGILDVGRHGVTLVANGMKINISFYTNAWSYCFRVDVDGYGVYLESHTTVERLLSLVASGDRWALMMLRLMSMLGYRAGKEHAEKIFNPYRTVELDVDAKCRAERRVLNGIWISIRRWKNAKLAADLYDALTECDDVFLNRKVYSDMLRKLMDVKLYFMADKLTNRR